jgi:uracil-DNA glycosylase family 4
MTKSAAQSSCLADLHRRIVSCRACPRLVAWREQIAREKRAAFEQEEYWGKPIPGFGDARARLLICGLAPAAHGGNRTGRVFTGDRSGDWLYRALYHAGFANQPKSIQRNDGLKLRDCYITACVHCAPPANRPAVDERDRCLPFLREEFQLLTRVRVVVCLGGYAWNGVVTTLSQLGYPARPRPKFGHGATFQTGPYTIIGSYHPSQQNTFTGRLTREMLDQVFGEAKRSLDGA